MTPEDYQVAKAAIIERLGPPTYELGEAVNECAKELMKLKASRASAGRSAAKLKRLEDFKKSVGETEYKKAKGLSLRSVDLNPEDLSEFNAKEIDILRAWYEDKTQSASTLGNRFGWTYQAISKFLADRRVKKLDALYFTKVLGDNTKIALLKLTENSDPKIVLAAAEYLKILQDKERTETGAQPIDDPIACWVGKRVGDWLAGDQALPLVITKDHLKELS